MTTHLEDSTTVIDEVYGIGFNEGPAVFTNSIFDDIHYSRHRKTLLCGSVRSGKTYAILQNLINYAMKYNLEEDDDEVTYIIARKKINDVNNTVKYDFINILKSDLNIYSEDNWDNIENSYMLGKVNFVFCTVEDVIKEKHSDVEKIFINEVTENNLKDIETILKRIAYIYMDCSTHDYNNTEGFHSLNVEYNSNIIPSSFKDNLFLDPNIYDELAQYEPTKENIEAGTADEDVWEMII